MRHDLELIKTRYHISRYITRDDLNKNLPYGTSQFLLHAKDDMKKLLDYVDYLRAINHELSLQNRTDYQ